MQLSIPLNYILYLINHRANHNTNHAMQPSLMHAPNLTSPNRAPYLVPLMRLNPSITTITASTIIESTKTEMHLTTNS
jgi:hypothetical protein